MSWETYVNATKQQLTNLFQEIEEFRIGDDARMAYADRANLVIVGDKTLFEWMLKLYCDGKVENPNGLEFKDWYKSQRDEMCAKIVAAGWVAGKCVEIYVPNEKGTLPTEPENVVFFAGIPESSSEIQERCKELGFDISNTTEINLGELRDMDIKNITQERCVSNARERMRANYDVAYMASKALDSPAMLHMFFGKYMKEKGLETWDDLKKQFLDCLFFKTPAQ